MVEAGGVALVRYLPDLQDGRVPWRLARMRQWALPVRRGAVPVQADFRGDRSRRCPLPSAAGGSGASVRRSAAGAVCAGRVKGAPGLRCRSEARWRCRRRDEKKQQAKPAVRCNGAPGEIRTPDRLVRSQVLYPTELRARFTFIVLTGITARTVFQTGAPGEIRTPDRLVRSQVLYPTELRARRQERNYADMTRMRQRFCEIFL